MQFKHLTNHLSRTGWPPLAVAEFIQLLDGVNNLGAMAEELARRINTLALGHLVTETVMEHHGLWNAEVGEAIKPLLAAKAGPQVQPPADEPEPAHVPEHEQEPTPHLRVVPDAT